VGRPSAPRARPRSAASLSTSLAGSILLGALALPALVASPLAPAATTSCSSAVGYRVMHIDGRVVAVWYPTAAPAVQYSYGGKFSGLLAHDAAPSAACGAVPLVVFSHGDLGCGLQSAFLTESLARSGYVVAAPDHADAALCHTVRPAGPQKPPVQPAILDPSAWSESSRADRRADVEAVIAELLASGEFRGVIDPHKIGLAGHSLGGYTVVGMAGGWESWRDPRVSAVVALSPYVMPFQVRQTLGNVRVPLMYQGGTADVGITPFLKGAKGAYAQAHSPAYFVELRAAGHFAWVNCGREQTTESCLQNVPNARLSSEYTIAFFNHYLKGLDEPVLGEHNPALAELDVK
jgi:predicted dienelactone hydrolase